MYPIPSAMTIRATAEHKSLAVSDDFGVGVDAFAND